MFRVGQDLILRSLRRRALFYDNIFFVPSVISLTSGSLILA